MKRREFLLGLFSSAAAYALAGCATAEKVAREALRADPKTRKYVRDFDRYAKIAHKLKKYHDKGNLDENDILDVLHSWGVTKTPAKRPIRRRRKSAAKPFPTPEYAGRWRWPMKAGVVSSEYGKRWGGFHYGIDIAADMGTPLYAAAPGEVIYSGNGLRGYGNVVIIRHDQRTSSIYGHNKRNLVKPGQKVKPGQRIALLGSTGHSTGPHVHFEIRREKKAVPPRKVLPKSRF